MSKFIDAIRVIQTGKRFTIPSIMSPLSLRSHILPGGGMDEFYEYIIEATWGVNVRCRASDLSMMQENVIEHLREAIYGEFRERVLRLERALYEHDFDAAITEVRDLWKEVHG